MPDPSVLCPRCRTADSVAEVPRLPTPTEDDQPAAQFRCARCSAPFAVPAPSPLTPASGAAVRRFTLEEQVPAVWRVGDEILGQYVVRGVLGEGGMGTVYRVRHLNWNR